MKKWWFGERKHVDQDKVQAKAKAKNDMRDLMDTGDEQAYVAYVKALRPKISPDELVRLIEFFREQRRQRR
jgi:hypothetical protein